MQIKLSPEQEARLKEVAAEAGTNAEQMMVDAALQIIEQDEKFRAAVREGIAQADREEFIEESEMNARLDEMLRSRCESAGPGPRPQTSPKSIPTLGCTILHTEFPH